MRMCREAPRSHQDDQQGVHLAEVAEQLRSAPLDVDNPHTRRRHLLRRDDRRQLLEARVGDRRHAHVRRGGRPRERVEERRLPRARKAHDSRLERHARSLDGSQVPTGRL